MPTTYATPLSAVGPATAIWTWFAGTFFGLRFVGGRWFGTDVVDSGHTRFQSIIGGSMIYRIYVLHYVHVV